VGIVVRFLARCSCRFELLLCSHLFNAAHMCQQQQLRGRSKELMKGSRGFGIDFYGIKL